MIMNKKYSHLEKILKSVANRRRLCILALIQARGKASVIEIANGIDLSFKATSKHLGILYSAGILERDQVSLNMYYSLADSLPVIVSEIIRHL